MFLSASHLLVCEMSSLNISWKALFCPRALKTSGKIITRLSLTKFHITFLMHVFTLNCPYSNWLLELNNITFFWLFSSQKKKSSSLLLVLFVQCCLSTVSLTCARAHTQSHIPQAYTESAREPTRHPCTQSPSRHTDRLSSFPAAAARLEPLSTLLLRCPLIKIPSVQQNGSWLRQTPCDIF